MIDAHNHLQDPRFLGKQGQLIDTMKEAGITGCVVNGTSESDWPEVARLAQEYPEFVTPSFGLHPWKGDNRSPGWLETLTRYLKNHPRAGLGECGLDRWMAHPDLTAQHEVFRQQIALAVELNRPLTIHCLKAWGPLLAELHAAPALPKFLLHSFAGSKEIANECLKLGAYFSFSGYFLHPRKVKVREVFQSLPPARILIETDAPDMAPPTPDFDFGDLNHPVNLVTISRELAILTGIHETTFLVNVRRFFKISMTDSSQPI